jgi:mono/diheme cytochrome c family protein
MNEQAALVAALLLVLSLLNWGAWADAGDAELGRRLYREGILASGQPVQATVQSGLSLRGGDAACAKCHRRSGFGANEGYTVVRPITGPFLFHPESDSLRLTRRNIGKVAGARPAYDDDTFPRVLREGVDPVGRVLDGMMPRYALDATDARNLTAYMRTLSAQASPGVDQTTLHFATVVDDATDPEKSAAMREVLEAYFKDKNAGTRREGKRVGMAPWAMDRIFKSYRSWKLHYWRLQGPPDTWGKQLDAYYRDQPVFAIVGGIGEGSWQPVHDFCERSELPCLFPNIAAPPTDKGDFYSLYFSRGANLEAESIAVDLKTAGAASIVQVYRHGDEVARAAARSLRMALPESLRKNLSEHVVAKDARLDTAYWRESMREPRPTTLVLWLKVPDLDALAALEEDRLPARIYLSASLVGVPTPPPGLLSRVHLAYPFDLPVRLEQRLTRLRAWLRVKGIAPREEGIQVNTFFAINQVGEAIMHLVDNFSREFFIELIEHGIENSVTPSLYPAHSLGPGQRYASKGSYIVRIDPGSPGRLVPTRDWIVP